MKLISYNKSSWTGLDRMHHVNHHILVCGKRVFSWHVDRPVKSTDWTYRNLFQSLCDDYTK
jgi:hypothetical protein